MTAARPGIDAIAYKAILRQRARKGRHNPTPAEQLLWEMLQKRQLGVRAGRQRVLCGRYIADFYVPKWRLAIEVDGSAHHNEAAAAYDADRDAALRSHGYSVLRVSNDEVLKNRSAVYSKIVAFQAAKDEMAMKPATVLKAQAASERTKNETTPSLCL